MDPSATPVTPASPARAALSDHRRWVVKIGSALITQDGRGLHGPAIAGWAADIAALRAAGKDVVLVCSGAVASGVARLGMAARPEALHLQQAVAAVGQMGLVQAWETAFSSHGLHTAQVLLTHHDLAGRQRYLNARSSLRALLEFGVVPVVNENDTVASDEIRLGDNDTLAALVANLVEADALLLLTDQAGLHRADPRQQPDAPVVPEAMANDPALDAMAGGGGQLGRGGMVTKVRAARLAARSGAATLVVDGRPAGAIARAVAGAEVGTLLLPGTERLAARKQWLAGHPRTEGQLVLDAGAVRVLRHEGRSLLPVGVLEARGSFRRGDVVACITPDGQEVARGLVNYASDEVARMAGLATDQVAAALGYQAEPELVHRDNLVLLAVPISPG